jgi:putative DNA methylase
MANLKFQPDQQTLPGIDPNLQTTLPFSAPKNGSAKKAAGEATPNNLGKAVEVAVPDFSDPNRPKTCLEVDFPIVPINALSQLEGNAGKPIYQMSKWWARRRSSVFRALLIAAAMEAPARRDPDGSPVVDEFDVPIPDETEAAKAVWDVYYANHQKAGSFKHLRVLDCFMGGGTTLVEGSRLGFQVAGVDLNPVAWFVVKNELSCTDPAEVAQFFEQIESEVKPVIQPFYVTDCPRGHSGSWFRIGSNDPANEERMPAGFDPFTLTPEERKLYRYEGSEVIYTFWAKHGPCSRPGCNHRTPIFRTPVIAEKKFGVKYIELTCKSCKTAFHAELGAARMAPGAEQVVLDTESPFTELSQPFAQRLADYSKGKAGEKDQRIRELCEMVQSEPGLNCPTCHEFSGQYLRDVLSKHRSAKRRAEIDKKHLNIQPARNGTKPVYRYLLIDPEWLKGSLGNVGSCELGGYSDASVEATSRWYEQRLDGLRLIEVRGRIKLAEDTSEAGTAEPEPIEEVEEAESSEEESSTTTAETDRKEYGLPRFVTLSNGRRIETLHGTIPQKSHFTCGRCGLKQDLRQSMEKFGHGAPVAVYAIQGYCPSCANEGWVYDGRFFSGFDASNQRRLSEAEREWDKRRNADLAGFWPTEEITPTYMTHHANFALPKQGYTHWWKMFNSRQLLLLSELLRAILQNEARGVRDQALGAFQQYLRNQNMFCIYDVGYDKLAPFFSNPNYAPKARTIENTSFSQLGRGNLTSITETVVEGLQWACTPWEVAPPNYREETREPRPKTSA